MRLQSVASFCSAVSVSQVLTLPALLSEDQHNQLLRLSLKASTRTSFSPSTMPTLFPQSPSRFTKESYILVFAILTSFLNGSNTLRNSLLYFSAGRPPESRLAPFRNSALPKASFSNEDLYNSCWLVFFAILGIGTWRCKGIFGATANYVPPRGVGRSRGKAGKLGHWQKKKVIAL